MQQEKKVRPSILNTYRKKLFSDIQKEITS